MAPASSACLPPLLRAIQEWAVFLEPDLYDEFERCHIGADEELKRVRANRSLGSNEKKRL